MNMKLAFLKPAATSPELAVKLVRQLRAAHPVRRLPREDIAFPDTSVALTSRANAFLDRVAEWPLTMWLDTGRALVTDRAALPVRQAAWEALDAVLASSGLGFAAWSMRDAVETLAFLKTRELCEWTPTERRYFASAHGAAEAATLAVLARDYLRDEEFQALVAAFAQCVSTE